MRLACVGASGYGNVGDDGYRLVFAEHLAGHELLFDCPYPDLRAVDWCEVLIVGGGGLIYTNETAHFSYMSAYLDRAIELRKPVVFLSCGIQIKPQFLSPMPTDIVAAAARHIMPWAPYLEYASLVTVRSPTCARIVQTVAPRQNNVHFAHDACYLMPRASYALATPGSVVFIPTARGLSVPAFNRQWAAVSPGQNLCIAAFARDDNPVVDQLVSELGAPNNLVDRRNLSAIDAMAVVQQARLVVTARYHGAVFARAAGIPQSAIVSADDRYKGLFEEPPSDARQAMQHFELVGQTLARLG